MIKATVSARGIAFVVALASAAPLAACGGTVSSEQAASAGSALTTRAPVAVNAHGAVRFFGQALGDVPLSPAQRSEIEQLAAEADARHADERAARGDLLNLLAAQVQSGALDRAALQPKLDAVTAALQKAQPADRAAIERLHAILTPDQRVALVDAVKARFHERMGKMRGAHPLKKMADDLQLTDDQRAQLRAAFRAHFEGEKAAHDGLAGGRFAGDGGAGWDHGMRRGAKVLSAFEGDHFVLDEIAPPIDLPNAVAQKSGHFLTAAEVALPILTPAQRAVAAQKLRDRATGAAPTTDDDPLL
jgi:Spy/CpxP family protein refolding chaperone